MEGLVVLSFLAFAIWRYWGKRYLMVKRATAAVAALPRFTASYFVVDVLGFTVALDPAAKKVAFVDNQSNASIYRFRDIISLEPCKDGVSVTKTNRGNQIVVTAIGQLLFREKGFIVGGETASQTTSQRVIGLSIKIYMDDIAIPKREITIYSGTPLHTKSRKLARYVSSLEELYGRLLVAMKNP